MRKRRRASEQRREVDGWRKSGVSAAQYAAQRGYSVASLTRWARSAPTTGSAAEVDPPRFVRLEMAASPRRGALVVEVGAARVVVEPGFDAGHLCAVVAALATGSAR